MKRFRTTKKNSADRPLIVRSENKVDLFATLNAEELEKRVSFRKKRSSKKSRGCSPGFIC